MNRVNWHSVLGYRFGDNANMQITDPNNGFRDLEPDAYMTISEVVILASETQVLSIGNWMSSGDCLYLIYNSSAENTIELLYAPLTVVLRLPPGTQCLVNTKLGEGLYTQTLSAKKAAGSSEASCRVIYCNVYNMGG